MSMFPQLEEQNLFLIQNSQEAEQALEEVTPDKLFSLLLTSSSSSRHRSSHVHVHVSFKRCAFSCGASSHRLARRCKRSPLPSSQPSQASRLTSQSRSRRARPSHRTTYRRRRRTGEEPPRWGAGGRRRRRQQQRVVAVVAAGHSERQC